MKKTILIIIVCCYNLGTAQNSLVSNIESSTTKSKILRIKDLSYTKLTADNENFDYNQTYFKNSYGEINGAIQKSNLKVATVDDKESSNLIYLSVTRYNNKVVDISPFERNLIGNIDFRRPYIRIDKNEFKNEDLIELLSKYEFEIKDDIVTRKTFTRNPDNLPSFLTITTEVVRLK